MKGTESAKNEKQSIGRQDSLWLTTISSSGKVFSSWADIFFSSFGKSAKILPCNVAPSDYDYFPREEYSHYYSHPIVYSEALAGPIIMNVDDYSHSLLAKSSAFEQYGNKA